jgi:pimeloyl-ACP methyl ester carboxylesterase
VWQAFARRLLPELEAVAPDLRGHGQSDAPPAGYAPTDYAHDLVELIEGAPWLAAPVPVIGHSLGALVAVTLAKLRPDLVPWLVLLDPPLDPELRNPEIASVYRLRHAAPGELEAYLLSRNPGAGQLLAQSLAKLFRVASDAAFEALLDPANGDGAAGKAPSAGTAAAQLAPRIQPPCLVLQADPAHGGVLGDAAARAFVDRLPNGRLLKIPGASHALHASHPAEVARAILEFYASVSASGSR